jgi:hypothetical protein
MVLQEFALIEPLLKHQGPTIVRIVELHWRDFAVFVSLSSRTNTRQGLRLCRSSGDKPAAREHGPDPFRGNGR